MARLGAWGAREWTCTFCDQHASVTLSANEQMGREDNASPRAEHLQHCPGARLLLTRHRMASGDPRGPQMLQGYAGQLPQRSTTYPNPGLPPRSQTPMPARTPFGMPGGPTIYYQSGPAYASTPRNANWQAPVAPRPSAFASGSQSLGSRNPYNTSSQAGQVGDPSKKKVFDPS